MQASHPISVFPLVSLVYSVWDLESKYLKIQKSSLSKKELNANCIPFFLKKTFLIDIKFLGIE